MNNFFHNPQKYPFYEIYLLNILASLQIEVPASNISNYFF